MKIERNPDVVTDELSRDGFVVLADILRAPQIEAMLARLGELVEQRRGDPTVKKGGVLSCDDLLHAGAVFEPAYQAPVVVAAVESILGPRFEATRVNYRAPLPGGGAQALHTDYLPVQGDDFQVATAIIALSEFTAENGAPRVLPGTHRTPRIAVPKSPGIPFEGERLIVCAAGSALVFNGHLWHSGTRNNATGARHALQITYSKR